MKISVDGEYVDEGGGGGEIGAAVRYNVSNTSSTTLLDRTVNTYTGSGSSVTFTLPSFQDNPGKVIDLIVDINNYSNSNDLSVSFSGYGIDFWIASTDENISLPLTVDSNSFTRFYITQTAFVVSSKPVFQVTSQKVYIPTV